MYETFYKLRASPFQLAPDPVFFYDSGTHRRGLIKLRQCLDNGSSISTITGNPGTGKTELLNYFSRDLESENFIVANIPITRLRANNILDYIATAFGVVNMGFVGDSLWSKEGLLVKIQQQIYSRLSEGKKFVILIDNAESLSINSLEKILQLCAVTMQDAPLVQCFLFGEGSIVEKLAQFSLRELPANIADIKLDALGDYETRHYIEHRLIQAGWQGDPEITHSAYQLIYGLSEGIPWHINLLCHRVFLQGYLEDTHQIDEKIVHIFRAEEQLQTAGVCGSDIASSSNVINMRNTFNSRSGTNEAENASPLVNSPKLDRQKMEYTDEVASSVELEKLVDSLDELPISIDDVQAAFASATDEAISQEMDGMSTKLRLHDTKNKTSDGDTNKSGKNNIKRDVLLDRIIPVLSVDFSTNTPSSGLPNSYGDQAVIGHGVKEYPMIFPVENQNEVDDSSSIKDQETVGSAGISNLSPMQIASSASIATSLIITLIIWVLSDNRVVNTQVAQSIQRNSVTGTLLRQPDISVNSISPSPFRNPNDVSRARKVLK